MANMKTLLTLLAATVLSQSGWAANATPDFYLCTGKVGGEWNFGRAPNGCNASSFGSDKVLKDTYGDLVFMDGSERTAERKRYMQDLHAVIRDAAEYYIKKRKPNAPTAEVEAFKLGILTTASQETFWSHYRFASDSRYKMMRGDVGHGHGLMQVDDRHHFPAVTSGTAWNLIGNITYGMDEYFANWERAPAQSCVGSATNYEARIRAAWAAYNGGPGKICRWTNPNDKWAHNDKGFYDKLKSKSWKTYVADLNKIAPINVPCLVEKRENCPAPGEPEQPSIRENVLYRTAAGTPCVLVGGGLKCMAEFRDSVCLRSVSSFTNGDAVVVTDQALSAFPRTTLDRHATCKAFDSSLINVGKVAEAKTNINLRSTPGGGLLTTMNKGVKAEVLDFEIRNLGVQDRYYKVTVAGKTGFVYGGDKTDHANWLVAAAVDTTPSVIARPGEKIQILNAAGINMRTTPGGTLQLNIPKNTQVTVIEFQIKNAVNDVYYKVTYKGKTGYVYSGALLPRDTTSLWTKRIK